MGDIRLSGAGDTPEGCGAIQRDPGQAKGVGPCEPHEVKGAKSHTWVSATPSTSTSWG